jgi:hypothetical protein
MPTPCEAGRQPGSPWATKATQAACATSASFPGGFDPCVRGDPVGVEQIPGERELDAVDGEVAVERRRPPEVVQPGGVGARLRPQVGPARHRLAEGPDADQLAEERRRAGQLGMARHVVGGQFAGEPGVHHRPGHVDPGSAYVATGDGGQTDIPDGAVSLVVTDPPYMDNVHYSELADFFHAWLRSIGPYPAYPTGLTTRDEREVQNTDADAFRTMAADVWRECARVLSDDGLLVFSFHQSHASGWEAVMRSLADANFMVSAVRPVVAEVTTSLTKVAALAPNRIDVIIVCRKTGVRQAQTTPVQARKGVVSALIKLQKSGLTLGDGDARSATRAAVLALGTCDPRFDWEELRRAAEEEAELASAQLRRNRRARPGQAISPITRS